MKKCCICKIDKPLDEFSKDRTRKDGFQSQCKPCIKAYREANKEKLSEHLRNRRKNDPLFKLKCNLRNRTRIAFKSGGYRKTSKTQEMLGVDWEVVSAHIERQFTKGMSWSNYGEWHIDHIIPLSSAKTEAEIIKLCHYSNLQPLWAEENLSKNNTIEHGTQSKLRI